MKDVFLPTCSDLLQNPQIVPVKVLQGSKKVDGLGTEIIQGFVESVFIPYSMIEPIVVDKTAFQLRNSQLELLAGYTHLWWGISQNA